MPGGCGGTSGEANRSEVTLTKWMAVAATVTALAAAPGAWARSSDGGRVAGDEPQYLMTAISLGEDGGLDIADERAERRWAPFHESGPPPVQAETRADGSRVSPHDPLLPAVLAGPVRIGGWLAARLTLTVMAGALAATLVWVAVRRFGVAPSTAAVTATIFTASAPLAVYGTQVYPELPAALAVTAALGALLGAPGWRTATVLTASVVALPWLSVKYAPVAAVLALAGLVALARRGRPRLAAAVAVTWAGAGLAYLVAHQVLYDGWTVYAAGDYFVAGELSVMGTDPDYADRSVRLLGLLVDRSFGLVAWQPAYLLAVPALAALARRRPPGTAALLATLAAGWLTATFAALTMHGWWWPGRQVVVVLPVAVLAVARWAHRSRIGRRAVLALGAVGLVTYAVVVAEALLGRITVAVSFEDTVAPFHLALRPFLPDYRSDDAVRWLLHAAWIVVVAGLAVLGWRHARHPEPAAAHPAAEAALSSA